MAGARDADSFYVQDCRQVQNDTHAIQGLTGQISRLVNTLESEGDFERCRSMINDSVQRTTETKATLMRIREHQHQAQNVAESNNRRMMYTKLKDNLAITARVLEDVVRRFRANEQKHSSAHAEVSGDLLSGGVSSADVAGGEDQPMVPAGGSPELEGGARQALDRVDEEMRCLQAIYTDLSAATEDQKTSFDTLECHMAEAAADVERGCADPDEIGRYGDTKRKFLKMVGGGLALVVVLSFLWS